MIIRRAAVVLVALALAACSTSVDGMGRPASGVPTNSGPVPCGSTAVSQAPGCTPPSSASSSSPTVSSPAPTLSNPTPSSPTPTSSASSSTNALPTLWQKFRRTVYRTPLGDPAVLNVCKVADGTNLSRFGLTLNPPTSTLAGSCSLDFAAAKVKEHQSVVISVLRSGPDTTPTPKRTKVLGQSVYAFPYDKYGACLRELVTTGSGVTTTVSVRLYGTLPGGRTTSCGVSDALIASFAAVAAGRATPPTVPTNSPSLFALDACKVAAAARISSSALAAGNSADPTDYDTSCSWTGSSVLFVSTGILRNPSAKPDGKAVTAGGHTVYNTATVKGTCNYASKQAGGETVEVYYSRSKPATASQCMQAAALLGRYLDALKLH